MASLKEGDRVQVGKEVLVWQREGASRGKTSVRILFGGRKIAPTMYLMKLCLKMKRLKKMMLIPLNMLKIMTVKMRVKLTILLVIMIVLLWR